MVTKRDDRPTTDRVNIEQSATGRLEGRVLQFNKKAQMTNFSVLAKGRQLRKELFAENMKN